MTVTFLYRLKRGADPGEFTRGLAKLGANLGISFSFERVQRWRFWRATYRVTGVTDDPLAAQRLLEVLEGLSGERATVHVE